MVRSKGGFFCDEKSRVISHHYSLKLTTDTNVWITVEPLCIKPGGAYCSFCTTRFSVYRLMIIIIQ